jgi:hypothetical protein
VENFTIPAKDIFVFYTMQPLVYIQNDSKLLSEIPWPIIFKPVKTKIKLFTEYESVTQQVLLSTESILHSYSVGSFILLFPV